MEVSSSMEIELSDDDVEVFLTLFTHIVCRWCNYPSSEREWSVKCIKLCGKLYCNTWKMFVYKIMQIIWLISSFSQGVILGINLLSLSVRILLKWSTIIPALESYSITTTTLCLCTVCISSVFQVCITFYDAITGKSFCHVGLVETGYFYLGRVLQAYMVIIASKTVLMDIQYADLRFLCNIWFLFFSVLFFFSFLCWLFSFAITFFFHQLIKHVRHWFNRT